MNLQKGELALIVWFGPLGVPAFHVLVSEPPTTRFADKTSV